MSQLSEWRRKVQKKSQQVLAAELGYEKWQTYAAQESGKNPLPPEVKAILRGKRYKYEGEFPDEESAEPAGSAITRDDFLKAIGGLEAKIRDLEGVIEDLGAGLAAAIPSMPKRFRRAAPIE